MGEEGEEEGEVVTGELDIGELGEEGVVGELGEEGDAGTGGDTGAEGDAGEEVGDGTVAGAGPVTGVGAGVDVGGRGVGVGGGVDGQSEESKEITVIKVVGVGFDVVPTGFWHVLYVGVSS